MNEPEHTFKALADASRRTLLDLLFHKDGQSLSELVAQLELDPAERESKRFGVMKHLRILEDAGLVTTRKVGREKLHYLNPVPIQQVYDRWVSKYAQPWTRTLIDLKSALENPVMPEKHSHVFVVFIRTTPEKLWHALTDGTQTARYYFDSHVQSMWQAGAPYAYMRADGPMIDGEVIEVDPPRKLVTTFRPVFLGADVPTSRVTFEIEPEGAVCKLTLTHDELTQPLGGLFEGWSRILSGLKTLLETGASLENTPA